MKFFAFAMMLCCVSLPGAEIPLDSSFTALSAPQDAPVNWTREFGHQGGFGICRSLSETPCNMLQVLTFAKLTNFYYKEMFKVVPGDRVTLEAEVCGEGGFCMTLYLYDSSYITALPRRITELNDWNFRKIKYEFDIGRRFQGRTPKIARVVFCIAPESLITVRSIKGIVNEK